MVGVCTYIYLTCYLEIVILQASQVHIQRKLSVFNDDVGK